MAGLTDPTAIREAGAAIIRAKKPRPSSADRR
jgi:hypothetical protein